MKKGFFCNSPLENALQRAGFKVEGIEKKGKKTVITVEPVILNSSTGADNACCGNSCVGAIQGNMGINIGKRK